MKCGQSIPEAQVFCDGCLEVMAQYPVNPDTPAHIIPRKPPEKTQRKRELSAKELLARQQRINRRLRLLVLILTVALSCILLVMLLWTLLPGYDLIPGITKPF